jgi:hypothetical protein
MSVRDADGQELTKVCRVCGAYATADQKSCESCKCLEFDPALGISPTITCEWLQAACVCGEYFSMIYKPDIEIFQRDHRTHPFTLLGRVTSPAEIAGASVRFQVRPKS